MPQGQEVGAGLGEAGVGLVGRAPLLGRALAGVLDGQGGGDDQHLAQAAVAVGLEDHAAEAGVDGQPGQALAVAGQPAHAAVVVELDGAELVQEAHAVGHGPAVGRVEEGEAGHVAEAEGGQLEDDRGQVGAEDLGLGERRAGVVVGLVVEADADAGGDAPAAAGPLGGRGLRDRLDGEALDLEAVAVARDAGRARVDDVADPGHGDRGLGHVGGQHDATARVGGEGPALLGHREPGVEGEHLGVGQGQVLEGAGRVADLALARQEHQDVARALAAELADGVGDAGVQVAPGALGLVVGGAQGAVADLDRVGPARHLDDGGAAEVAGEGLGVDGGRGDDDLEVGAAPAQLGEVADEHVDVEAALVGLVHDDRVVGRQVAVAAQLGQQDAVSHELDEGVVADLVGEAHGVAHGAAEVDAQLVGDAVGHGARRQAAGLGVADHAPGAAAQLEAQLGELGGLARARLAGHDHDLVGVDGGGQLVAALGDGQLGRVGDGGHGRLASGEAGLGEGNVVGQVGELRRPLGQVVEVAGAVEAPAQGAGVGDGCVVEAGAQVLDRRARRRFGLRHGGVEDTGAGRSGRRGCGP